MQLTENSTILFQGDSITDALRIRADGTEMGTGYPQLLAAKLSYEYPQMNFKFCNRGISGNRIIDLYARWTEDCINLQPDVVSILIGVNDIWHDFNYGQGVEAEKFEKVYDMLLEETVAKINPKLVLLEPFALKGSATADRWSEWKAELEIRRPIVHGLAQKHGAVFVPLQERFDAACRLAPPAHWLRDGVHPKPAGHMLIAKAWLEETGVTNE